MTGFIVNIDVPSLESGVRFYTEAFGCALRRTLFDGTVAELMLGEAPIYLIERHPGTSPYARAAVPRSYERHWTPLHLDLVVDHLDDALARAIGAGAVLAGEVSDDEWGRIAPLADPFGHGICLLEFSRAGYDAAADSPGP